MSTYVTFRLDGRAYAAGIDAVREVVRLGELVRLPGMAAGLAGVLDLRGTSLPVVDVRAEPGGPGDVLVVEVAGREIGFACDEVTSVTEGATLLPEESRAHEALPAYVEAVLRGPGGAVFLVDLPRLAVSCQSGGVAGCDHLPEPGTAEDDRSHRCDHLPERRAAEPDRTRRAAGAGSDPVPIRLLGQGQT